MILQLLHKLIRKTSLLGFVLFFGGWWHSPPYSYLQLINDKSQTDSRNYHFTLPSIYCHIILGQNPANQAVPKTMFTPPADTTLSKSWFTKFLTIPITTVAPSQTTTIQLKNVVYKALSPQDISKKKKELEAIQRLQTILSGLKGNIYFEQQKVLNEALQLLNQLNKLNPDLISAEAIQNSIAQFFKVEGSKARAEIVESILKLQPYLECACSDLNNELTENYVYYAQFDYHENLDECRNGAKTGYYEKDISVEGFQEYERIKTEKMQRPANYQIPLNTSIFLPISERAAEIKRLEPQTDNDKQITCAHLGILGPVNEHPKSK